MMRVWTGFLGGQNFFVPDFNKLPYSLRSQGVKNTCLALGEHSFISSLRLAAVYSGDLNYEFDKLMF